MWQPSGGSGEQQASWQTLSDQVTLQPNHKQATMGHGRACVRHPHLLLLKSVQAGRGVRNANPGCCLHCEPGRRASRDSRRCAVSIHCGRLGGVEPCRVKAGSLLYTLHEGDTSVGDA